MQSVVQLWCKCQWAVEFTNSFLFFNPVWEKSRNSTKVVFSRGSRLSSTEDRKYLQGIGKYLRGQYEVCNRSKFYNVEFLVEFVISFW